VLFGSAKYGGLEIPELYTDQGFGQLKLLFGHVKLRDEVGQQILCFLSELQLFIGSSSPILSLPFQVYGKLVGDYWLVSIWKHMSQIGYSLDIESAWTPPLSHQLEAALMDLAVKYNFTTNQLKEINHCRVYLQVLTVSTDVSDAQGLRLLPAAINGDKALIRTRRLHWPAWQRPTSWGSWRQLLHHISARGRLLQELGPWVAPLSSGLAVIL